MGKGGPGRSARAGTNTWYWYNDKQARHVRERCIDSFKDIFLSAIVHVLFRETVIHCLKISGNKNKLRTIRGWNRQKN